MNRILVLDDIRVGMYVTILNCPKNLPLLKYKGCVLSKFYKISLYDC